MSIPSDSRPAGPRCIALVGPYSSGKTTLLEGLLFATGATQRKGSVSEGNTVGDSAPEARAHGMSTEVNAATTEYMGEEFTFVDCPGSIEFFLETMNVLPAVDAAIVVTDPDPANAAASQSLLKHLSDRNIPHVIFVNKIDKAEGRIRDLLEALQPVSERPLVLRQIPIWENEIATGFVDLALDRAYVYREHVISEVIQLPDEMAERRFEARYEMLEKLADFDDKLMEELLEDIEPPQDEVFDDLAKDFREGLIVPVLLGSAERDHGIRRLLKLLRHEAPGAAETVARAGVAEGTACAEVLKTYFMGRGGKVSLVRVLSGTFADGATIYTPGGGQNRISGISVMKGQMGEKLSEATAGQTVGISRMDSIHTGDALLLDKAASGPMRPDVLSPVYGLTIHAAERKDEVKMTEAVHKVCEEDPAVSLESNLDTKEMVLWGQGEVHLRVAIERLKHKYGLDVTYNRPKLPYKEAIRKPITQHARHKRQSGGHGQFGDITVEIAPLPRGSGFQFHDKISGGVVPRQYIPAVEAGAREYLEHGPLGFPVVDVSVTLVDGQHHAVDSSEMAFKTAGRLAMTEALPQCSPVLLEPIMDVEIFVPQEATAKINALVSTRRGQVLGFDAREGWSGWDAVRAHLPQVEVQDLIIELRSITHGMGTYKAKFDHLSELTGKEAEQVLAAKAA